MSTTKQRYATIDLNSGFVWWVGEADSAQHACQLSDAEGKAEALPYEAISRSEINSSAGGYGVYEVPPAFTVDDGQDPEAIEAVQVHQLVGYYRQAS